MSLGGSPGVLPARVVEAWRLDAATSRIITIGLVNQTYEVRTGEGVPLIVQRLHPVFGPEVNLDLEALTQHLAARGMTTPRLVRARDAAPWVEVEGAYWRAITKVEGRIFSAVDSPALAREAGALCGRFHRAVGDLDWELRSTRSGVHDTAAHLAKLERVAADPSLAPPRELRDVAAEVSDAILQHAAGLEALPSAPLRWVHGDLKITNLLFDEREPARGVSVIDLDTLARSTYAVEMGDALRSWCNVRGESAPQAQLDPALYAAALSGWGSVMSALLDASERDALALGTQTISLELAARFATDVFEDRYFGWDPSAYPSRRAHCLARARAMLSLAGSVAAQRSTLERLARAHLELS